MTEGAQRRPGRVVVPHSRPGAGIGVRARMRYWRRIFSAYFGGRQSHLTFWHGTPEVNLEADPAGVDQYWQAFLAKADYPGHHDADGIPMLDYQGHVGLQYNPIAIAQWGLGNWNRWRREGDPARRETFLKAAGWAVDTLVPNEAGIHVWRHDFAWEYRTPLPRGWYSALSQGQMLSLLVRAHLETGDDRWLDAAWKGFRSFEVEMEEGGVAHTDADGYLWFEETVVDPPTHILNGYMWAAWGLHDLALHTGDERPTRLFDEVVRTLRARLDTFDVGYWSLYDHAGTPIPNAASRFYHHLHVVQLRVMHRLTGDAFFAEWADRWQGFRESGWRRRLATAHKSVFKLLYY